MLVKNAENRGQLEFVSLENMVPQNHLLRKIDTAIDFKKIYEFVEDRYCEDNGRPSVDPVVLFKIVLIQHIYGISSLRRTLEEVSMNLAYRWFIGYPLNEAVPHFSTVSYNFKHRFNHATVEYMFRWVLKAAAEEGYLDTEAIFVDGTHIKASANLKKQATMLTSYNLKMPHTVYGGENAIDKITDILKASGASRVAMFTDKGIEACGLFSLPEEAVKATGLPYDVLDDLPAEPSYMAVQKMVDEFKKSGADFIVACGGGSVLDAAKLASVLVTDEYGVKELLDEPGRARKCVPIVLIPTTAGTGAEVTPNAIVAVPEKELKVGIVNDNIPSSVRTTAWPVSRFFRPVSMTARR